MNVHTKNNNNVKITIFLSEFFESDLINKEKLIYFKSLVCILNMNFPFTKKVFHDALSKTTVNALALIRSSNLVDWSIAIISILMQKSYG